MAWPLALLAAGSLLASGCGKNTTNGAGAAKTGPVSVSYTGIGGDSPGGHGGLIDVTYSDGQGGTVQEKQVPDGWTKTIEAHPGDQLTFSVQESRTNVSLLAARMGVGAPTTCKIDGPDGIAKATTSTGSFSVATCSVTIPGAGPGPAR